MRDKKRDWYSMLLSGSEVEIQYCHNTGHIRARKKGGKWIETEEGEQASAAKYAEMIGMSLLSKKEEPLGAIVLRKKEKRKR